MIMNKFQNKIAKLSKNYHNVIVAGSAFGSIQDLLEICDTVFVVADKPPSIKAKNLVYRQSFSGSEHLPTIDFLFFDLSTTHLLEQAIPAMGKHRPLVLIEGANVIGRDISGPLYNSHYNAVHQDKHFHVWKSNQ